MANITEISVLPPNMHAEGNLPVVQCLQCHQPLKEAANQTRTLLDLKAEVKKLKAIVLRSDSLPTASCSHNARNERPVTTPPETRVNFNRQKKMKVSMSPQSKLARLHRLRLAASAEHRAMLPGADTIMTVDAADDEEVATSSAAVAAQEAE